MLLYLAAVAFAALSVQPQEPLPGPGSVVINSQTEWERFAESPPRVDFAKHTVVAVFAGEKPTAGYSMRVLGVDKQGETCEIRYRVQAPPRDAMVAQVITNVFAVIRLNTKCAAVEAKDESR